MCIKCEKNNHKSQECRIPTNKLKCDSCNKLGYVSKVCIATLLLKKKQNPNIKTLQLNSKESEINLTDYSSLQDLEHIEQIIIVDLFSNSIFNDTGKYFIQV